MPTTFYRALLIPISSFSFSCYFAFLISSIAFKQLIMLSCSFRSCMAAGVLLTFDFFTHLIPKLSHVNDGTRFERVFPKMLDTRNRRQPPAFCFDGSVQPSCFSVLRLFFTCDIPTNKGNNLYISHQSLQYLFPCHMAFPLKFTSLVCPLNNNDHCHKHRYLSPSTARSLYDVMNGGCHGGKGRELGGKKRWNKANSIVLLFFFPPSARMIDDTEGRPRGPATMGKR